MKYNGYLRVLGFITGIALGLMLTSSAVAQSATGMGKADVLSSSLDLKHRADLHFGQILPGSNAKTVYRNPRKSSDAASFLLRGTKNSYVVLSFRSGNLSDGQDHTLTYTPEYVGHTVDVQPGGKSISNPEKLAGHGTFFMWVGGQITVKPNQAPGLYETTIEVNAQYY